MQHPILFEGLLGIRITFWLKLEIRNCIRAKPNQKSHKFHASICQLRENQKSSKNHRNKTGELAKVVLDGSLLEGQKMVKMPKLKYLKSTENVAFEFSIAASSTIFCPLKSDLSGNAIWPQASDCQKLAEMDHFWHFNF